MVAVNIPCLMFLDFVRIQAKQAMGANQKQQFSRACVSA